MSGKHEEIFWDLIQALDESGLLPHVMIVGSWAEYLFPYYFGSKFDPNLKTRDIDVYYGNHYLEVPGAEKLRGTLRASGFLTGDDYGGQGKFFKEGIEVEFLSSQFGAGPGLVEIPFTGIYAEKLDNMEILVPVTVKAEGYEIRVPTPASYIAHKLLINPQRRTQLKRQKDIEAVRSIVLFIRTSPQEMANLCEYLESLPSEKRKAVEEVAEANAISLP